MKNKILIRIDNSTNDMLKRIKTITGKNVNSLINEGICLVISKYANKPRNLDDALILTAGIAKGKIINPRNLLNKNIIERSKR